MPQCSNGLQEKAVAKECNALRRTEENVEI